MDSTAETPPIYIAFDLGRARIGAAASDALGLMAHPRGVHPTAKDIPSQLSVLAREEGAGSVVLGLPRDASGGEGPQALWVRDIGEKLRTAHGLDVHYWDERLTTVQASSQMRREGVDARGQKGKIDEVAARLILQSFLDARNLRAPGGVSA